MRHSAAIALLCCLLLSTAATASEGVAPQSSALRSAWASRSEDEALQIMARARAHLRDRVLPDVARRWMTTPWTMAVIKDGLRPNAEFPRQQGRGISCSWFIVRALQDAGIELHRPRAFAGAIAVDIQHSFLDRGDRLWRRRGLSPGQLHGAIRERGDGWYVLGLSYHVGLVQVRGDDVHLVHASYLPPQQVVVEDVLSSPAIADSTYFVVSPLLTDRVVRAWLGRRPVRFRPFRRSAAR